MDEPVLTPLCVGPGLWRVVCSTHGPLLVTWSGRSWAGLDAMGHAAAHHQPA